MSLPTAVRRNLRIPAGSTLIVDEAHALRNPDTKRQNYVRQLLQRAGRVYALTGTPGYNDVTDWASLINIVAKRPIVPVQDAEFKRGTSIKSRFRRRCGRDCYIARNRALFSS